MALHREGFVPEVRQFFTQTALMVAAGQGLVAEGQANGVLDALTDADFPNGAEGRERFVAAYNALRGMLLQMSTPLQGETYSAYDKMLRGRL